MKLKVLLLSVVFLCLTSCSHRTRIVFLPTAPDTVYVQLPDTTHCGHHHHRGR